MKILHDFEKKPRPLPDLLDKHLSVQKLSDRDRAFVSHLVYGAIRNLERLDYLIENYSKASSTKKRGLLRNVMRTGVFQLLPDSKVPVSAAINETVKLTRAMLGEGLTGYSNAVMRAVAESTQDLDAVFPSGNSLDEIAIRYCLPAWLVEMMMEDYGADTAERFMKALSTRCVTTARVNTIKTSIDQLLVGAKKNGTTVKVVDDHPEYIQLPDSIDLTAFKPLQEGHCFVQNTASGVVVDLLSPEPGQQILDACAAPGGKTAAIAGITGKPERISAVEVDAARADTMGRNFERLGISSISIVMEDARNLAEGQYDLILVDAPCSGLGTISKHPEIKYIQGSENIDKLAKIQFELLTTLANRLKPHGKLVYSVCTLSTAETTSVMREFLRSHRNFSLDVPAAFRYHLFVRDDKAVLVPPDGLHEGMFAFRACRNK